ncbi:hypothetical protein [Desulfovibrio cuneatus]|uniref:hypothetical protein n=1 Tax=Desulfovibrio cuneatus TaxID=159728 RepID=UPI000415A671|nr:hypothetical protein [Desulfovibrio cuneatus]
MSYLASMKNATFHHLRFLLARHKTYKVVANRLGTTQRTLHRIRSGKTTIALAHSINTVGKWEFLRALLAELRKSGDLGPQAISLAAKKIKCKNSVTKKDTVS